MGGEKKDICYYRGEKGAERVVEGITSTIVS